MVHGADLSFLDLCCYQEAAADVLVLLQLRRFDVVSLHKGSITSLTWSANGMKLFSGDDKGRVVFSSLDLDQVKHTVTQDCLNLSSVSLSDHECVQGVCKPVLLLEEPSGVVQMEYRNQVLLVSTQHRSVLYCTQKQEVLQLGTKPRKRYTRPHSPAFQ